jgi:hypothetical protein
VRYRLMATYDGSPFEAGIGPTGDDVVLFAACPPPEELGFEPATGHWRKQLRFADVQAVWESKPVGTFGGERCLVLDDLGDRLHIAYLGHDAFRAEQLGYWQVDRGVFELIAPRTEVTNILEERVELVAPDHRAAPPPPGSASAEPAEPSQSHELDQLSRPARADATPPASPSPVYVPIPDDRTGVTLPTLAETPLPLEAEAMRAASASRLRDDTSTIARPQLEPTPAAGREAPAGAVLIPPEPLTAPTESRQRRSARKRLATEALFADLASLAGIPAESYSVGAEAEGALCLVATEHGFEVFLYADGARHELQFFDTEEAACFYLFGVLAAEAVRTGTLARVPDGVPDWHARTA